MRNRTDFASLQIHDCLWYNSCFAFSALSLIIFSVKYSCSFLTHLTMSPCFSRGKRQSWFYWKMLLNLKLHNIIIIFTWVKKDDLITWCSTPIQKYSIVFIVKQWIWSESYQDCLKSRTNTENIWYVLFFGFHGDWKHAKTFSSYQLTTINRIHVT